MSRRSCPPGCFECASGNIFHNTTPPPSPVDAIFDRFCQELLREASAARAARREEKKRERELMRSEMLRHEEKRREKEIRRAERAERRRAREASAAKSNWRMPTVEDAVEEEEAVPGREFLI